MLLVKTLIYRPINDKLFLNNMFHLKLRKMEATVTMSKASTDAKTREMNIKAQQAAKADIKKEISHNIVTGKPLTTIKSEDFDVEKNAIGVKQHNTGKPKPKAGAAPKTTAPAKKEAKPKLSEKIDELISKAGKWEDLIASANQFCVDNGLKSRVTIGSFHTQVNWRRKVQKQTEYAIDRKFTDKGIEKIAKPKK